MSELIQNLPFKMKVLIIEDEPAAARQLKRMIKSIIPTVHIWDTIDSVEQAIQWFEQNATPDLAFFDIQLSDGLSFDIFKQVNVTCPIIFTTAYDEYAIQAFQVNSIDYLLKPIEPEALERAIKKYEQQKAPTHINTYQLQQLLASLNSVPNRYKSRFLVKKGQQLLSIAVEDIAYFLSEDKVTFLVVKNRRYPINYTLDEIERLINKNYFFRLNRKLIVHFKAIQKIHKYFNSKLLVEITPALSEKIIVSREKATIFKRWLDS